MPRTGSAVSAHEQSRAVGLVMECQTEGLSTAQLSRLKNIASVGSKIKILLQNSMAQGRNVTSVPDASITPDQPTNTTAVPITAQSSNPAFRAPFLPTNHEKPSNTILCNPVQPTNPAIHSDAQPTNPVIPIPVNPSNPALPPLVHPTNLAHTTSDQPTNPSLITPVHSTNPANHTPVHPTNPATLTPVQPTNPPTLCPVQLTNLALSPFGQPANPTFFTPVHPTDPSSLTSVHSVTTTRSDTLQSTTTSSSLPDPLDTTNSSLIKAAPGSNNASLNVSDISKKLNYIYVDGDQNYLKYPNVKTVESASIRSTGDKVNGLQDNTSQRDLFPLLDIFLQPMNALLPHVTSQFDKELDEKLKAIFSYPGKRFVEWLLNEGLLRKTQHCKLHDKPIPMHLLFADVKQTNLGCGYIWISWYCCKRSLSVYSDSIFELACSSGTSPVSILRLIYHWAYQSSIDDVKNSVQVDVSFVNLVYKYLRCVCSVVVEGKINNFGINGTTVEISIVSLGTCWTRTSVKEAKVVILGVYDRDTKFLRFFASDPMPDITAEERYLRILRPLRKVVHKDAIIVCDQTVEVQYLHQKGYMKVVWDSKNNEKNSMSNSIIVYYLCQRLPKMFKKSLPWLNIEQMQMVLDELCWRERYGNCAASSYNTMVEHIIQLTTQERENPVPGVIELLDSVLRVRHEQWLKRWSTVSLPQSTSVNNTDSSGKALQNNYNGLPSAVRPGEKSAVPVGNVKSSSQPAMKEITDTNPPVVVILPSADRSNSPGPSHSTCKGPPGLIGMMQVDSYYYGTIPGNTWQQQFTGKFSFTCHICQCVCKSNIKFYNHLKYHLQKNKNARICCDFCLEHFLASTTLSMHLRTVHLHTDERFLWCRICSKKFATNTEFAAHMRENHNEAELPYRCHICNFATSFYFRIINHFNTVHYGSPHLQCHFCLTIMGGIGAIGNSAAFSELFFTHLKTHLEEVWKCSNCELRFHSDLSLKIHINRDHISRASSPGLQRSCITPSSNNVLVPLPCTKKSDASFIVESLSTAVLNNTLDDSSSSYTCIECKGNMQPSDHFPSVFKCTKCRYSTCCHNMIDKHLQLYHPYNSKSKTKPQGHRCTGSPTYPLLPTMCCTCGFSSSNGNQLAGHLAVCKHGQKIAVPMNLSKKRL